AAADKERFQVAANEISGFGLRRLVGQRYGNVQVRAFYAQDGFDIGKGGQAHYAASCILAATNRRSSASDTSVRLPTLKARISPAPISSYSVVRDSPRRWQAAGTVCASGAVSCVVMFSVPS